jgi:hypothetical protein
MWMQLMVADVNPVRGIWHVFRVGWDSVDDTATHYGLDSLGIKSWRKQDFPHPSKPALGTAQLPVQWLPSLFPGLKQRGHGTDHPSPSSTDINERIKLNLYSHSGPSEPVLG